MYRAYFALLYGYVLNEIQSTVTDPEESKALLHIGLRRLPPADFLHIRGLETELGDHDSAAELELGLNLLLTGIDRTLDPRPAEPHEPPAPGRRSRRLRAGGPLRRMRRGSRRRRELP